MSQLGAMLDAVGEGLAVFDEGSHLVAANREAMKLFAGAVEPLGRTAWSLAPHLWSTAVERAFRDALKQGAATTLEHRWPASSGTVWFELRVVPAREGVACFYRDITERKGAEVRTRDSETRLRDFQSAAEVGTYEINLATRRLQASPVALRLYGFPEDAQVTVEEALARIHPDDRDGAMALQTRPEDFGGYAEYRIVLPDGQVRWLGREAGVLPTEDGQGVRIVAAIRDIGERRSAEAQIRFQARLLDDIGQAVIATDTQGMVVYWNKAAEALYGWSSVEAVGRHVVELKTTPEDAPEAQRLLSSLLQGVSWSGELQLTHRDGHTFTAYVTDSPIRDADGQMIGIVGTSFDVSRRKRAEDHLNMMVNELNHRVKNTLATVQSVAVQTLRGHSVGREVGEAFTARLVALSQAHDILTSEQWAGGDLRDLVGKAAEPYQNAERDRFSFHGPRVRLEPKTAIAVALALHELTTNAVKYGALSNKSGVVNVDWAVLPNGDSNELRLVWQEKFGPPVTPPTRQGFGSRLILRSLPQELNGTVNLSYPPEGVVCRITARLEIPTALSERPRFVISPAGSEWDVSVGDVSRARFGTQREAIAFVSTELEHLRLAGRGGNVVFRT